MRILLIIFFLSSCAHQSPQRAPSAVTEKMLEWEVWPLERDGCQSRKDDFLVRHSKVNVTWEKILNKNCRVLTGKWKDFFTGEEFTQASEAVVTVVVPFQHLRRKGLRDMPAIRITSIHRDEEFFIILKRSEASFERFKQNVYLPQEAPVAEANRCAFYGMWKDFKEKWGIKFRKEERELLQEKESACTAPKAYNREFFKHWSPVPGMGCHARIETLKRDTLTPLADPSPKNCTDFTGGSWMDLYSGNLIDDPKMIDIDHFVPLMNAYVSGAWKWPWWKKELYANFMKDPFHLVAVSARENRSKGAKHPGLYMPPFEEALCDYVREWVAIKLRWNLSFTVDEASAIDVYSMKCGADIKTGIMESVDFLQSNRRSVNLKE